jgi:hypothetical protein
VEQVPRLEQQCSPDGQVLPQAPQFAGPMVTHVSLQHSSRAPHCLLQLPHRGRQVRFPSLPGQQRSMPGMHCLPHVPQSVLLVRSEQPSRQQVSPGRHALPHRWQLARPTSVQDPLQQS